MKVFISYSWEDEAIAHLLAYILNSNRIECLIDRQLPTGRPFDPNLRQMIKDADRVLLLLTKSSLSSAWVNQEIGFAMAHGKPIWPLAMEEDIEPIGMLSTTQSYSLFDWSDPPQTIRRLVKVLKEAPTDSKPDDYPMRQGFDQIITGKIERTRLIVARLRELRGQKGRPLKLYIQAAFSPFAVSNDRMYKEAGNHSDAYMKLLMKERGLLDELIKEPRTNLKMLLWPVRAYENKYLAIRYRNLLNWMRKVQYKSNIEYACAQYLGPNRLIVPGEFCVAGYKLHHTSGYEMSAVTYDSSKIAGVVEDFEYVYDRVSKGGGTKARAVEEIESMYKNVSQLSTPL
jgi:TIR domain